MMTGVPSTVPPPAASRQRPDCGLCSVPSPGAVHCWAPELLQVHRSTRVLFAVPPPVTSRHFPSDWKVFPMWLQNWLLWPLQVYMGMPAPSAVLPPLMSTHFDPMPLIGPPTAGVSRIRREPWEG